MRSSPILSTHLSAENSTQIKLYVPALNYGFDSSRNCVRKILCSCFSSDYNIISTVIKDTILN